MKTLRLSELCALIEDTLSMDLADRYWVRAEIASLSQRGGHAYFELVEPAAVAAGPVGCAAGVTPVSVGCAAGAVERGERERGNGGVIAKVRATCWSNIYTMLKRYFEEQSGLPLQVGMQVLLAVRVDFHAVYGLSLQILDIDPAFTIGDLARSRRESIARLEREGVMDLNRSLSLPTIIEKIAVISSAQAAGYEDFVEQLRQGGFRFETTLYPAMMQGIQAPKSIIAALRAIDAEQYDCVVILRGGGAITDLTCFDDYDLAAHCAQYPVPILTGIGHTKDISVLDMVAFAALKTPTALAQYFVDGRAALEAQINALTRRLTATAQRQLLIRRHAVELLEQRLTSLSPERIFKLGYSLTTRNGQILTSVSQVRKGDIIETHLQDGVITTQTI